MICLPLLPVKFILRICPCLIRNVVPVWRVKFEETWEDLVEQFFLVVGSRREGRKPNEEDVHNYASRPDVDLEIHNEFYVRCSSSSNVQDNLNNLNSSNVRKTRKGASRNCVVLFLGFFLSPLPSAWFYSYKWMCFFSGTFWPPLPLLRTAWFLDAP